MPGVVGTVGAEDLVMGFLDFTVVRKLLVGVVTRVPGVVGTVGIEDSVINFLAFTVDVK